MSKASVTTRGLSPRQYAKLIGRDHVLLWRLCKTIPGLAVRVIDPTRAAGFRFEIDARRMAATLAERSLRPRRGRPPGPRTPRDPEAPHASR